MMLTSYFVGLKKYPIGYETRRLTAYFVLAMAIYGVGELLTSPSQWINIPLRTALIAGYLLAVLRHERVKLTQLLPLDVIMNRLKPGSNEK